MTMKKEIILNSIVFVIILVFAIIFEIFVIKEHLLFFFIFDFIVFIKEYLNMLFYTMDKYDYFNEK